MVRPRHHEPEARCSFCRGAPEAACPRRARQRRLFGHRNRIICVNILKMCVLPAHFTLRTSKKQMGVCQAGWLGMSRKVQRNKHTNKLRSKQERQYANIAGRQMLPTAVVLANCGGCTHVMHDRSRTTIAPLIPAMPGRSTSGFHRPGRNCLHQARSTARCWASIKKGELHPTKNRF